MALRLEATLKLFFDSKAVIDAVDKAERRVLSRFGAFVRKRARSSIRKRKAVSKPGQPPTSRTGKLKKSILFSYDPTKKSVVIGPHLFESLRGKTVPELLEYGGSVQGSGKEVWLTNDPGRDASGRFVSEGRRRVVQTGTLHYRERPFMGPAFLAEQRDGLPKILKDCVTK
jgi:hypothetical protein